MPTSTSAPKRERARWMTIAAWAAFVLLAIGTAAALMAHAEAGAASRWISIALFTLIACGGRH